MTTLCREPLSLVPSPREGNGRTLSPAVSFAHIARASPLSCPTRKMMQSHYIFPIDPGIDFKSIRDRRSGPTMVGKRT